MTADQSRPMLLKVSQICFGILFAVIVVIAVSADIVAVGPNSPWRKHSFRNHIAILSGKTA